METVVLRAELDEDSASIALAHRTRVAARKKLLRVFMALASKVGNGRVQVKAEKLSVQREGTSGNGPGVRPSSGAAAPGPPSALECFDAGRFADPAASEDGRTPARRHRAQRGPAGSILSVPLRALCVDLCVLCVKK